MQQLGITGPEVLIYRYILFYTSMNVLGKDPVYISVSDPLPKKVPLRSCIQIWMIPVLIQIHVGIRCIYLRESHHNTGPNV